MSAVTIFSMRQGQLFVRDEFLSAWPTLSLQFQYYYLHEIVDQCLCHPLVNKKSLNAFLHCLRGSIFERVLPVLEKLLAPTPDFDGMGDLCCVEIERGFSDPNLDEESKSRRILYVLVLADLVDRNKITVDGVLHRLGNGQFRQELLNSSGSDSHVKRLDLITGLYRWTAHKQCWIGVVILARCFDRKWALPQECDFSSLDLKYDLQFSHYGQAMRLLSFHPMRHAHFVMAERADIRSGLTISRREKEALYKEAWNAGSRRCSCILGNIAKAKESYRDAENYYLQGIQAGIYSAVVAAADLVVTGKFTYEWLQAVFACINDWQIGENEQSHRKIRFMLAAELYRYAFEHGETDGLVGIAHLISQRRIDVDLIPSALITRMSLHSIKTFISQMEPLYIENQNFLTWFMKGLLPILLKNPYYKIPQNVLSVAVLFKDYLLAQLCALSAAQLFEQYEVAPNILLDHTTALAVVLDSSRNAFLPDCVELPGITRSSQAALRHFNLMEKRGDEFDFSNIPGLLGQAMRIAAKSNESIRVNSLEEVTSLLSMHPQLFEHSNVLPLLLEALIPIFLATPKNKIPKEVFDFVLKHKVPFVDVLCSNQDKFASNKVKLDSGASACAAVIDTHRGISFFGKSATKSRRLVNQEFSLREVQPQRAPSFIPKLFNTSKEPNKDDSFNPSTVGDHDL